MHIDSEKDSCNDGKLSCLRLMLSYAKLLRVLPRPLGVCGVILLV